VLLLKPGLGGMLLGSTSCGAVLQVPTHTLEILDGPVVEDLSHLVKMSSSPARTVKATNERLKKEKRLETEMFRIRVFLNIVGFPPILFKHFM
jgi:hypothetical protein